MRRWVSLGGWCGPSLMLSKLGLRPAEEALPFDMVRCTFDGIVELTARGFFSSSAASGAGRALSAASPPAISSAGMSSATGDRAAAHYSFDPRRCDGYLPQRSVGPSSGTADPSTPSDGLLQPDPVHVWLLFRGQHACFTHFDLNQPEVQAEFQRRMRAWEVLLSPDSGRDANAASHVASTHAESLVRPVTFVRTVLAEDPAQELEMLPQFHRVVRERTQGRLPFRTVLIVHEQADTTRPLCAMPQESAAHQSPCVVWNLKRARKPQHGETAAGGVRQDMADATPTEAGAAVAAPSLLDECHDGYQTILTTMSKEAKWRSLDATLPSYAAYMKTRGSPFTLYTELSRVHGVPAVRGTCTGFGSTFSAALGRCVHCGCTDGHAVPPTRFNTARPWTDADVDDLLLQYALQRCDEVAAVEAAALRQRRGAHETWVKLRELLSD